MKKPMIKRCLAAFMSLTLAFGSFAWPIHTPYVSYAYAERPASVYATSLNVRSGAGTSYSLTAKLTYGTAVTVIDEVKASDGSTWYAIRFNGSNGETTGYAASNYIKFPVTYTSDTAFEDYLSGQGFPESYKQGLRILHAEYPNWVFVAQNTGLDWNTVVENEGVVGRNLVHTSSVSSWKSIADGAYDWDNSSWPGFDSSSWVAASEDIIRYYMDPRNFLDSKYVFQFLTQSYDSSTHTADGLQSMIGQTFLSGSTASTGGASTGSSENPSGEIGPGVSGSVMPETASDSSNSNSGSSDNSINIGVAPTSGSDTDVKLEAPHASITTHQNAKLTVTMYGPGMESESQGDNSGSEAAPSSGSKSYTDIIMQAAAESGVNPYVLAAMIIQEQGTNGTSGLISGTYSEYSGYYNFFNIEAYQSGNMNAIQRGLWYASQSGSYNRPWNTVEKAINGGAMYYGQNYVKVGQDTFYLKKFNVQGNNIYKHQYMTNVQGAASEAAKLSEAYSEDLKKTSLEFKIPVYSNMPDALCVRPEVDGSPNNKLSGLYIDGFSLTPTFSKNTASYDLIVDDSVDNITVNATAIDSTATVSGTGNISLQSGINDITIDVTAQNKTVRQYIIHVVRQSDGPTYNASMGETSQSGSGEIGPGVSGPGASGPGVSETTAAENNSEQVIIISPAG